MGRISLAGMIAAAPQPMGFNNLPFNWFDVVLVVVLGFGLWRGRKNGMSKEVMLVFQWLTLVLASGMGYPLFAPTYANTIGTGKVASAMLGYCTLALATWLVFYILKGIFVPRLTGSNFFGGGEYYLGMVSGMIRFACMLVAVLALLNAPFYTPEDIKASQDYKNRWFGGGQKGFSGDFIPSIEQVQEQVFKKSLTGPYLKNYLGTLLIDTAPPTVKQKQKKPVIHMGK
jgi:uncharacterized membrane protein required for colicin V production